MDNKTISPVVKKAPPYMALARVWDRIRPWKPHALVQPDVKTIKEFYHEPNPGIHNVADILPAPAIPPIAPEGPPIHGFEPAQPGPFVVVDRSACDYLVAPGKQFFADIQRNILRHV